WQPDLACLPRVMLPARRHGRRTLRRGRRMHGQACRPLGTILNDHPEVAVPATFPASWRSSSRTSSAGRGTLAHFVVTNAEPEPELAMTPRRLRAYVPVALKTQRFVPSCPESRRWGS